MEIKEGKSYNFTLPLSNQKKLCHIEAIILNTVEFFDDSEIIVFRYWLKHKQRWERKALTKFEILIWNDKSYVDKITSKASTKEQEQ